MSNFAELGIRHILGCDVPWARGLMFTLRSFAAAVLVRQTMARKVLNRKELRRESEAAEAAEADAPVKAGKKAPAKRKSRAKVAKEVRLKAFWGVFNQSMKRVALFDYSERKQADKKALELTGSQKSPHFVQLCKEVIAD